MLKTEFFKLKIIATSRLTSLYTQIEKEYMFTCLRIAIHTQLQIIRLLNCTILNCASSGNAIFYIKEIAISLDTHGMHPVSNLIETPNPYVAV